MTPEQFHAIPWVRIWDTDDMRELDMKLAYFALLDALNMRLERKDTRGEGCYYTYRVVEEGETNG